ncbi:BQ2448_1291 [Microbotryum intermedium]|uniref:DNA topoisomerase I n=1 Tax=Microbotryum intermedium TaxID=269621 RepID=A0A238F9S3_9BASI|nr:BQ2448_1291 [Microbotryum intermedium]
MTDAAAAPKYKKRVIQESSSDDSGDEDDLPLPWNGLDLHWRTFPLSLAPPTLATLDLGAISTSTNTKPLRKDERDDPTVAAAVDSTLNPPPTHSTPLYSGTPWMPSGTLFHAATKRPKPETSSNTNGHHAAYGNGNGSSAPAAPAPVVEMKDGTKTSASAPTATLSDLLFAAAAAADADSSTTKDKMSIFTTGDSDDGSENSDDSDDDDAPLASKQGKQTATTTTSKINNGYQSDSDSESDHAALKTQVKEHVAKEAMVAKQVEKLSKRVDREAAADDNSSEDEKPLATKAKVKAKPSTKKAATPRASSSKAKSSKRKNGASDEEDQGDDEEDSDDEPLSKKTKNAPASKAKKPTKSAPSSKKAMPVKKGAAASKVDKKPKKEESVTPAKLALNKGKGKGKHDDDEDVKTENGEGEEGAYKWWEEQSNDGTTKWKTLEHNGVMFPPEYEPHGVKMKYEGKSVDLSPEAEEVASFFAAILETDYVKNPVFVKNFFDSWLGVLQLFPPRDGTKITTFEKCDFTPIFAYLETEKATKKEMTAAQKKDAKTIRDIAEEPYKTCLLDGRKEKVGNFRIEPPGLFRGRGEHPKTGLLKTRVRPEQITINIGKDAPVPKPPAGHKWKSVVHDDTVTWLATWKENVNGNVKYVFLAAGSSLKGQSDLKKFEKARTLKDHVARIRRDYTADLKDKEMVVRQRATAIYLIDRFALRNGNEKGEDEADTVGCCSLRFEHVTLTPPTKVTFDFLGKDSIRYVNEVEVDEQVFKNLKIFKKEPKTIGDLLFDRLSTGIVNKYLNSYMDGLTAKVFRTYNASYTFQEQLKDTPADGSVADKILAYNRANRLVAVLCNHQRSVSKGHGQMMDRMTDKVRWCLTSYRIAVQRLISRLLLQIRALKYQRKKLRCALLASSEKKKYKQFREDESDLEDDWIISHEEQLVVLEREKIKKKFEKENLKRAEAGEKPLPASELKQRLEAADQLEKTLKAERKKGWKETKYSDEKLIAQIEKMDERILVAKTAATDRDEGKEVSLGTSKINYIDSRITIAWCKKHDVPLNKVFSKTLVDKFSWALDTPADFVW